MKTGHHDQIDYEDNIAKWIHLKQASLINKIISMKLNLINILSTYLILQAIEGSCGLKAQRSLLRYHSLFPSHDNDL